MAKWLWKGASKQEVLGSTPERTSEKLFVLDSNEMCGTLLQHNVDAE